MSFGYNNCALIKLLVERGDLVGRGKDSKIKKIDEKINS